MRRWIVPGTFYLLLCLVTALYAGDPEAAKRLLQVWMVHPYRYPFLDWEWLSRSVECWRRGVNVYVENPCPEPVPVVLFTQSPLWLRATFLPIGDQWVRPVGLALAVLFGLAIAGLPPVRRWYESLILILASVSSVTVFALERANVDVILFLMTMVGASLWRRSLPFRLLGYAAIFLAGLLKYYPLTALFLCLRERIKVFVPITATAACVVVGLVLGYKDELSAALHNVPAGSYFGDGFGAVNLPFGLAVIAIPLGRAVGLSDSALLHLIVLLLKNAGLPCLLAATLAYSIWLADKAGVRRALALLDPAYVGPLVAGAAVVVGCFIAGWSIGYRAIFLIPTLPGLLTMGGSLPGPAARRILFGTCLAILFVMWLLTFQSVMNSIGLSHGDVLDTGPAGIVLWLCKELAWWWTVGTLMAILIGFGLNSETFLDLKAMVSRQDGRLRNQSPGE